ncbi:MAG TPA: efflux RND transporter periplasmic adaptor subunit [Ramlibacter sp.]|uniref:efflux RND transporter periplasmic adaptor subunit n=1 Tax=Ramlibacter sp. TaxID=1917967 RepID=UPI002D7FF18F|nr:efflux RND transporter periplasmic adaptor subunit [Ramlibacter sp.]HET8749032.1 efflux RND transporter periplasmic adaptor subunit [Ramlibacter sp.]
MGRTFLAAGMLLAHNLQAAPASTSAQPLGCLIEPYSVSDLGSPVVGVIEQVLVERGDRVRAGQPLATLRADVERVSVHVAQGRAQAHGELRAAEANAELARQKLARAADLARQEFISAQALEQARAEALVAENRLVQAREQRDIYQREHELAQAQLGLRTIRSPSNGVVADRFMSAGERVEEKPMFRIAVIDPLRVEVVLPASLYPAVSRGTQMRIAPEFPGAQPRLARVVLVDKVIEGASNTFRARLTLPNADNQLPAGLRCKAELVRPEPAQPVQPAKPPAHTEIRLQGSPVLRSTPRL